MAGARNFEIQLGHLCNDRCVFCVSGQLTSLGRAPLLHAQTLQAQITEARRGGYTRLTFLGGEPTIQPFFLDLVRHAVGLGFDEIVIFTNGSKAGRTDLVEQVVATGGRFEWRFSVHGATREAHERTTRRKGSYDQLLRAMAEAHRLRQKITVNACLVQQNYQSIVHFPELLRPFQVRQLHVDMLNPYDMGVMSDAARGEIMPRYRDLVGPLERMIAGLPQGFDVNIGNLPFCVAPHLAPWIHHGGEETWHVSADHDPLGLVRGKDKYRDKLRRRTKPATCSACTFNNRCSGVFQRYRDHYGDEEFVPVPSPLVITAPTAPTAPAAPLAAALERLRSRAPFGSLAWTDTHVTVDGRWVELALVSPAGEQVTVWLALREDRCVGGYRLPEGAPAASAGLVDGLRALMAALGRIPAHPDTAAVVR